ncbi:MAG: F420H(2):quinone oxidoreductase [Archaeoglobales archaeon]|nr:MAG: F420H(2):quinone oxidoreductase [Archaeoglobales archaeon]
MSQLFVILATSLAILLIAYLTAISSKDLIRLLISLELMFGSVFLVVLPMFSLNPSTAFAIVVLTIFTSSSELLILITAIVLLDRTKRGVDMEKVSVGGEVM